MFKVFLFVLIQENGKNMSIAERLQLNALIKDYSGVDQERIEECFRDNK